jgi:hypothetical protein
MGGSSKKIRDSQTLTPFFVGKTPVSNPGSPAATAGAMEKARSSRGTRSSKSETALAALRAARGAGDAMNRADRWDNQWMEEATEIGIDISNTIDISYGFFDVSY